MYGFAEIEVPLDGARREDRHYVPVIDRRRGTRLSFEAPAEADLIHEVREDDLQGHSPAKSLVFGKVDRTHAATAEVSQDPELTEPITRAELAAVS